MGRIAPTNLAAPACAGATAQQDTPRRPPLQPRQSHIQRRRIRHIGPAADQDRLMPRAFQMRVRPRLRSGDPPALPRRQRYAAVERGRQFQCHKRSPQRLPRQEPRHRRARRSGQHAGGHVDPAIAQPRETASRRPWIGIADRGDDARDPGRDQRVRTRRPPRRCVRARLQRHIGSCAARLFARLCQRHPLGMRSPAGLRPATPDDDIVADDDAADIGIGRGPSAAPFGERERRTHPAQIVYRPHLVIESSTRLKLAFISA